MTFSESEILRRIRGGERHLYARLVDRYKDRGMTLALRMLRNRQDAEESLQDAFMRAYRGLDRFEGKSTFGTWFYRILYNVCLSRLGKKKQEMEIRDLDIEDEGESLIHSEYTVTDTLPGDIEAKELSFLLTKIIDALPEKYATIITLFYLQERTHEEIVEILNMPEGTVKTHLHRARALLRQALAKEFAQEGVAA